MEVYIWIAALGIIAFISLIMFLVYFIKDKKLISRLGISKGHLIFNSLLLLISIGSFSLMGYFIIHIKDQLVHLT